MRRIIKAEYNDVIISDPGLKDLVKKLLLLAPSMRMSA